MARVASLTAIPCPGAVTPYPLEGALSWRCGHPNTHTPQSASASTMSAPETVEGFVIDVACVRKHARDDLLENARTHSRNCALMGHCVESGYGIVTADDRLTVLDPGATPQVVDAVEASETDEGIRLRVRRERQEDTLQTVDVEQVD